jgi:HAD superfamily hydrolase (TIGR01662 family)
MKRNTSLLLIDLDHTIIRPASGKTFPINDNDWEFIPGVLNYLRDKHREGYSIAIVSNQGGIKKGFTTAEQFETKANEIVKQIKKHLGITITNTSDISYHYCGAIDSKSFHRKPNCGMAYDALREHHIPTLKNVIMVGDLETDKQFAENLGIDFQWISDVLK